MASSRGCRSRRSRDCVRREARGVRREDAELGSGNKCVRWTAVAVGWKTAIRSPARLAPHASPVHKEETMRKNVEFNSKGSKVRGVLVTPDAGKAPFPVAVMGGGWCYVKEIVLPHYAEAIVKAGVAVLMFDYRGLGESEGEPRQHIDPVAQIEDYKNAISFVSKQPEVDPRRVGIWGISYAGGHVIAVAATDPRVKCAVSTVPVVEGWETMKRCHGERKFEKLLALLMEDR